MFSLGDVMDLGFYRMELPVFLFAHVKMEIDFSVDNIYLLTRIIFQKVYQDKKNPNGIPSREGTFLIENLFVINYKLSVLYQI